MGTSIQDMRAGSQGFSRLLRQSSRAAETQRNTYASVLRDEETAGDKGIGYLTENGFINSDYGVYCETYEFGDIMVADSGTIWLEITTLG